MVYIPPFIPSEADRYYSRVISELVEKVKREATEVSRLRDCIIAIAGAGESIPASVLRSVAYDIGMNCITADVAAFQIERRASIAQQAEIAKGNADPCILCDGTGAVLEGQRVCHGCNGSGKE